MKKSSSESIKGYIKNYRVGALTGTTRDDLKQSKMSLINKQNMSKTMERSETQSKHTFYKEVSRKTGAFSSQGNQESGQIRPFSNYMSLRPQTALKFPSDHHEKESMTDHHFDQEDSLKPRNVNIVAHFERNLGGGQLKRVPRTQSAFNIRNASAKRLATAKKPETSSKFSSHQHLAVRDIQSAAPHKHVIIEEEGGGQEETKTEQEEQTIPNDPEEEQSINSVQKHHKEIEEVNKFFSSNPKACMEHALFELEKCQEVLGVAKEETEKRQETLKREQLKLLTGKSDGSHPWDHVSLYINDEPEFNNPSYQGDYKRQALLKVQEKDERELRLLLDEAEERLEFYKKHAAISYDTDFTYLKVTQARLTGIEVDKIKQEFKSKTEG
jgi:hypothetical protein